MTYEQTNTTNIFSLSIILGILISITRWYAECWTYKQKKEVLKDKLEEDEDWGQFIIIDQE